MKKTAIIQALQPSDLERIRHIAGWYLQEWHTPPERTLRRLSAQGGEDVYFQLIATVDGVLAGTGGLCRQVNILGVYPELAAYGPWVSLLYVAEGFRNLGVGTKLLRALEQAAREQGLDRIYLYTFTAESLYRRDGWQVLDRVVYKGYDTAVMGKDL